MRIHFLGTAAGTPTPRRNVTAQAVVFEHGPVWMLDCGEGTQHRLLRSPVRAVRIARILLTHLHGDHCYGLPGLLSAIAIHGRRDPVEVVGPPGTAELIATVARLSALHLPYALRVLEIDGRGELAAQDGWAVAVRPLAHRIACQGYILREDPRPGAFHPERARALGIPEGRLWGALQRGRSIEHAGRRIVPPMVMDPPRPGRVVALLGDTCDADAIADAAQGCDLLVCEATYDATRAAKAVEWGHMTAAATGALAARLAARALVLTHFSQRYDDGPDGIAALVAEARAACPGIPVEAAQDGWSIAVP